MLSMLPGVPDDDSGGFEEISFIQIFTYCKTISWVR